LILHHDDEEESVPKFLFNEFVKEVNPGVYLVSALELALLVLKVVRDIELGDGYGSDAVPDMDNIN